MKKKRHSLQSANTVVFDHFDEILPQDTVRVSEYAGSPSPLASERGAATDRQLIPPPKENTSHVQKKESALYTSMVAGLRDQINGGKPTVRKIKTEPIANLNLDAEKQIEDDQADFSVDLSKNSDLAQKQKGDAQKQFLKLPQKEEQPPGGTRSQSVKVVQDKLTIAGSDHRRHSSRSKKSTRSEYSDKSSRSGIKRSSSSSQYLKFKKNTLIRTKTLIRDRNKPSKNHIFKVKKSNIHGKCRKWCSKTRCFIRCFRPLLYCEIENVTTKREYEYIVRDLPWHSRERYQYQGPGHCFSLFLALAMLANIFGSIYLNWRKHFHHTTSLMLINIPNLLVLFWELATLCCSRKRVLLRYKGRCNVYWRLPLISFMNLYSGNSIYLDFLFLRLLQNTMVSGDQNKKVMDIIYQTAYYQFYVFNGIKTIATIAYAYQALRYCCSGVGPRLSRATKTTMLNKIAGILFLCDQRFQFELINPTDFNHSYSFLSLQMSSLCRKMGALNLVFKELLQIAIKVYFFFFMKSVKDPLTTKENFPRQTFYIQMYCTMVYFIISSIWYYTVILWTEKSRMRYKALYEHFLHLATEINQGNLCEQTFKTKAHVLIALKALREHYYSKFKYLRIGAPPITDKAAYNRFLDQPRTQVLFQELETDEFADQLTSKLSSTEQIVDYLQYVYKSEKFKEILGKEKHMELVDHILIATNLKFGNFHDHHQFYQFLVIANKHNLSQLLTSEELEILFNQQYAELEQFIVTFCGQDECVQYLQFAFTSKISSVFEKELYENLEKSTMAKLSSFFDDFSGKEECVKFIKYAYTQEPLSTMLSQPNVDLLLCTCLAKFTSYFKLRSKESCAEFLAYFQTSGLVEFRQKEKVAALYLHVVGQFAGYYQDFKQVEQFGEFIHVANATNFSPVLEEVGLNALFQENPAVISEFVGQISSIEQSADFIKFAQDSKLGGVIGTEELRELVVESLQILDDYISSFQDQDQCLEFINYSYTSGLTSALESANLSDLFYENVHKKLLGFFSNFKTKDSCASFLVLCLESGYSEMMAKNKERELVDMAIARLRALFANFNAAEACIGFLNFAYRAELHTVVDRYKIQSLVDDAIANLSMHFNHFQTREEFSAFLKLSSSKNFSCVLPKDKFAELFQLNQTTLVKHLHHFTDKSEFVDFIQFAQESKLKEIVGEPAINLLICTTFKILKQFILQYKTKDQCIKFIAFYYAADIEEKFPDVKLFDQVLTECLGRLSGFYSKLSSKRDCAELLLFLYGSSELYPVMHREKIANFIQYTFVMLCQFFGDFETKELCAEFHHFVAVSNLELILEKDELKDHYAHTFQKLKGYFGNLESREHCIDFLFFAYSTQLNEILEHQRFSVFFDKTLQNLGEFFEDFKDGSQCADFLLFAYTTKLSLLLENSKTQKLSNYIHGKLNQFLKNISDAVFFGKFFRTQAHRSKNQYQIDEFNDAHHKITYRKTGNSFKLYQIKANFFVDSSEACYVSGLSMIFVNKTGQERKLKSPRYREGPHNFVFTLQTGEYIQSFTLLGFHYAVGFQVNTNYRNVLALPSDHEDSSYHIASEDEIDIQISGPIYGFNTITPYENHDYPFQFEFIETDTNRGIKALKSNSEYKTGRGGFPVASLIPDEDGQRIVQAHKRESMHLFEQLL